VVVQHSLILKGADMDKEIVIRVMIPESVWRQVKSIAALEGKTVSTFVTKALLHELEADKKEIAEHEYSFKRREK
jgi:hypothetical protein